LSPGCKGICEKYKATILGFAYNTRYADGQKRCQTCEIYMTWDRDSKCPCCGSKLRTKPRHKKLKTKYKEIQSNKKNKILIEYLS